MTDLPAPNASEPFRQDLGGADLGGDPACWLNRVCDSCGRFVDDPFAEVCPACGATRHDASR
jgi:rubrerythrin